MTAGFRIEKLRRDHPLDGVSSGRESLDRFLLRSAFISQTGQRLANLSRSP
jgi:hypothetical protein